MLAPEGRAFPVQRRRGRRERVCRSSAAAIGFSPVADTAVSVARVGAGGVVVRSGLSGAAWLNWPPEGCGRNGKVQGAFPPQRQAAFPVGRAAHLGFERACGHTAPRLLPNQRIAPLGFPSNHILRQAALRASASRTFTCSLPSMQDRSTFTRPSGVMDSTLPVQLAHRPSFTVTDWSGLNGAGGS